MEGMERDDGYNEDHQIRVVTTGRQNRLQVTVSISSLLTPQEYSQNNRRPLHQAHTSWAYLRENRAREASKREEETANIVQDLIPRRLLGQRRGTKNGS